MTMLPFPGRARAARLRRRAAAAVMLFTVTTVACDRSPTAPEQLLVNEIILAVDDGTFAYSHYEHWHGAPALRAGSSVGMDLHFTSVRQTSDEHEPPPVELWFTLADHPEYGVHVVIEDPTIGRWSGDRVRGTLEGLRPGASRMSFVVRRGTTTIWEAPPLNFVVQPALP
jgi:hypothetical protein